MILRLLTEHHLESLSFKGGCTGSSESTLVKIPHCWKSHVSDVTARMLNFMSMVYIVPFLSVFQKIITDFVTIEMAFHAKALEVYSQCFQSLNNISIDADIKVSKGADKKKQCVKLRIFFDPSNLIFVVGAQKNRLIIETVLLSTHNICFGLEIRKMIFNWHNYHSYLKLWKCIDSVFKVSTTSVLMPI